MYWPVNSCKTRRSDGSAGVSLRVGISRTTISSMERGVGVNSNLLFKVLHHLDLLHDLQQLVDSQLDQMDNSLSRKFRKVKEVLSNDFKVFVFIDGLITRPLKAAALLAALTPPIAKSVALSRFKLMGLSSFAPLAATSMILSVDKLWHNTNAWYLTICIPAVLHFEVTWVYT